MIARCLELLDAKYTFVNAALARHYGMPDSASSDPMAGRGLTTRAGTDAAGCWRWRCS